MTHATREPGYARKEASGRARDRQCSRNLNGFVYVGFPTAFPARPLVIQSFQVVNGTTLSPAGGQNLSAQSTENIAIASFNGHLYYAWKASDNHLNIATLL